jgi:RimJ/RimL family protein N-acetyltransferase
MNLRPATVADEKLLLDWRNDPTVVEMLHDPRPITPQEHGKWLRRILLMDHCEMRLFVAEVDGVPVGQGRIERSWKTLSPKTDTCHLGYSLGKAACRRCEGAPVRDGSLSDQAHKHTLGSHGHARRSRCD